MERDATPQELEQAAIDATVFEEEQKANANKEILRKLQEIDSKSIRALREGNTVRIIMLEEEAVILRSKLS